MKDFIDLKTFPLCGGKARLKSSHGFNNVSCGNCGAEYPVSFDTRKEAAAAWNERPIEDGLSEEIGKLEAENKRLRRALEKYADFEHHFSIVDGKVLEVFDNGYGVDDQEFGTWARDALKAGA